ncbi:hypothetical protein CPB84DRAFT_1760674 [Gymnopilus junonius]|uniref:Uncharacterized protein n=1 Tax=Gymnopilus junonius TaxID=109634 RepID=A0A9P5TTI5_GYMJU|nr:hypothetical protein CPB84DRAFT_1760674 [Gymnopilus junonius]
MKLFYDFSLARFSPIINTIKSLSNPSHNLYKHFAVTTYSAYHLRLLLSMKLPASSSILLATLAMSSSSSCLIAAAPAGSDPADNGMTSATSNQHIPSLREITPGYSTELNAQESSGTVFERAVSYPGRLSTRDSLVGSLVNAVRQIPVAGEVLGKVLSSLLVATQGPTGAKSMDVDGAGPTVDPQDMQALQDAISELSRTLNSTAPKDVSGSSDNNGTHDSGPSSSATPENATAKSDDDASTASSSPIPGNPPNSPINASLPVGV